MSLKDKPFFARTPGKTVPGQSGATLLEAAAVAALQGYCSHNYEPSDAALKAVAAAERLVARLEEVSRG